MRTRNETQLLAQGVVESVVRGPEGLMRRARIRTARGLLDRDVRKLCLLEGVGDVDNMN